MPAQVITGYEARRITEALRIAYFDKNHPMHEHTFIAVKCAFEINGIIDPLFPYPLPKNANIKGYTFRKRRPKYRIANCKRLVWFPNDPLDVEAAKQMFDGFVLKGMVPHKTDGRRPKGIMDVFDAKIGEIMFLPKIAV